MSHGPPPTSLLRNNCVDSPAISMGREIDIARRMTRQLKAFNGSYALRYITLHRQQGGVGPGVRKPMQMSLGTKLFGEMS
jgi:hypothetical protein